MISKGNSSITYKDILTRVSEYDLISYYFDIATIPTIICSPLRIDNNPSFGLYSLNNYRIYWKDFATKETGGIWDLLERFWGVSYNEVINRVWEDLPKIPTSHIVSKNISNSPHLINYSSSSIKLECKTREWLPYDLEYWGSYGISLPWLKYADVYPISHKIVIKNNNRYVFAADKYAYAYVEFKEGNTTLKIYQPYNTRGYKWSNAHDRSVISLWTKVPEYGDKICICSSLKDSLCLWENTGIPAICVQGEGYGIGDTAISELKRRFKEVFILFDNDKAGIDDSIKLSESTGFTNLVLPNYGAKDVSDLFKLFNNVNKFKEVILNLINRKEMN